MARNPFKPTRFEHEQNPLIWISPHVSNLESDKSVYVTGTRGSGKTSLLKALNWQERLHNTVLRKQISEVIPGYISVYFRVPDYFSVAMDRVNWQSVYPNAPDHDVVAFAYFSLAIEAMAIELLADAIYALRIQKKLNFQIEDEFSIVRKFLNKYPEVENFNPKKATNVGFTELSVALQFLHRSINIAATRGLFTELGSKVPSYVPGEMLRDAAQTFSRFIKENNSDISRRLHFKICVDDGEMLSQRQQRFLNTLVRKAQHPVFWVVSYVGQIYEASSTILPNQNLTDADRRLIDLDEESESDFLELCQAVTRLRLTYSNNQPDKASARYASYDIRKKLGPSHLNDLIIKATKGSISPSLRRLFQAANQIDPKLAEPDASNEDISPSAPIYQTYLFEKLFPKRSISNLFTGRDENLPPDAKQNMSAYLRRKQVAALLSLCSEYRLQNLPFAGWNIVLSMSDRCIRDYLEIMGEIYERSTEESSNPITSFSNATSEIAFRHQRNAIAHASTAKFNAIRENPSTPWLESSKLVDCLGQLSALLQGDHKNVECLRTPERGIFVFDLKDIPGQSTEERERLQIDLALLLGRCETDGLLRQPSGSASRRRFSGAGNTLVYEYCLHRRFSAHFRFSYRGPYEKVKLPMKEVSEIIRSPQGVDATHWAERTYAIINQSAGPEQIELGIS